MIHNIGKNCIRRLCLALILCSTLVSSAAFARMVDHRENRPLAVLHYPTSAKGRIFAPTNLCPSGNCLTLKKNQELNLAMQILLMKYFFHSTDWDNLDFAIVFSPHPHQFPGTANSILLPYFEQTLTPSPALLDSPDSEQDEKLEPSESRGSLVNSFDFNQTVDDLFSHILTYICEARPVEICLKINIEARSTHRKTSYARFGRKLSRFLAAGTKMLPSTPERTAFIAVVETAKNYFDHTETGDAIASNQGHARTAQELIDNFGLEDPHSFQHGSHNQTVLTALQNAKSSSELSATFDDTILGMIEIGTFDTISSAISANPILIAGPGNILSRALGALSLLRKTKKAWNACSKLHDVRSISCALVQESRRGPQPLYTWLVHTSVRANAKSMTTQTFKCSVAAVNLASSLAGMVCVPGLGLLVTELTSSTLGFLLELNPILATTDNVISPLQQAFLDTYKDDPWANPSPFLATYTQNHNSLLALRQALVSKLIEEDPYLLAFIVLTKLKDAEEQNGDTQMKEALLALGLTPNNVKEFTAFAVVLGPRSRWAADRVLETLAIR